MATDALLIKRFAELEAKMNALRVAAGLPYPPYYEPEDWQQWATSAQHIIRSSFGEASPHYQNFSAAYARCSNGLKFRVDELKGVFRAAKEDYDGGYAFSMQAMISGEIYSDFVALSKNALAEGAKDVAAVL